VPRPERAEEILLAGGHALPAVSGCAAPVRERRPDRGFVTVVHGGRCFSRSSVMLLHLPREHAVEAGATRSPPQS